MSSLVLNVAITLDGFISGPDGEYDWCLTDQDYGMTEFLASVDTTVMGWKTYEVMARMADTGLPPLRHLVFSRHDRGTLKAGYELIREEPAAFIARLKRGSTKDIWLFGGADFTQTCLEAGLVDEMLLAIHPILLGSGRRLFPHQDRRTAFDLVDSRSASSGLVQVRYRLKL
jgi:dihydrofolate reductase